LYLRELRLLQATIIDVDDVDELLRSHHELRATLIVAGREPRRLQFGRRDAPVLRKLRELLRDARAVARQPGRTRVSNSPA